MSTCVVTRTCMDGMWAFGGIGDKGNTYARTGLVWSPETPYLKRRKDVDLATGSSAAQDEYQDIVEL